MILWDPSFSTGRADLDEQHRFLFEFANNMEEVIKDGSAANYMIESFSILEQYIEVHFGLESKCMHQVRCPAADINDSDHERFARKVAQYKAQIQAFGPTDALVREVHRYLETWLRQHILGIDVQLRDPRS